MRTSNDRMLFLAGLLSGAIVGGLAVAQLARRARSHLHEPVIEQGLELRRHAEDAVQRAQQIASDAVVKLRAAAEEMLAQEPADGEKPHSNTTLMP